MGWYMGIPCFVFGLSWGKYFYKMSIRTLDIMCLRILGAKLYITETTILAWLLIVAYGVITHLGIKISERFQLLTIFIMCVG